MVDDILNIDFVPIFQTYESPLFRKRIQEILLIFIIIPIFCWWKKLVDNFITGNIGRLEIKGTTIVEIALHFELMSQSNSNWERFTISVIFSHQIFCKFSFVEFSFNQENCWKLSRTTLIIPIFLNWYFYIILYHLLNSSYFVLQWPSKKYLKFLSKNCWLGLKAWNFNQNNLNLKEYNPYFKY